jgi:tetratricopeptide (TPR) repeat protein
MDLERHILAAQGYSELGMPEDALRELDALGPALQEDPDVLNARLYVLMRARRWEDGLAAALLLCRQIPDRSSGYIHAAFCLHELGRTREAKDLLLGGPKALNDEATYHYNMGCYDAVLGNPDQARKHVLRSFEMDRKFRAIAKLDPDLASIREWLP